MAAQVVHGHDVAGDVELREGEHADIVRPRLPAGHAVQDRRHEVPVRQHRALGQARRAGGVEQPAEIGFRRAIGRLARRARRQEGVIVHAIIRLASDENDLFDGWDVSPYLADDRQVFGLDHQDARRAVCDDIGQLARRQPVVQQGQGHAGAGDAVIAVGIFEAVLGQDGHAVAGLGDLGQGVGQPPAAVAKLGIGDHAILEADRRYVRRVMGGKRGNIAEQHPVLPLRRHVVAVRKREKFIT